MAGRSVIVWGPFPCRRVCRVLRAASLKRFAGAPALGLSGATAASGLLGTAPGRVLESSEGAHQGDSGDVVALEE